MSKLLITSAGLAEIVNAEQSGTAPVVLSHIAIGTGQYTPTADMTALKSEFKRFDSVAGGAIGDNVIHLTVQDNSTDAYKVNEVGVFTESGTLFAVISQTTPIAEKSASSEVMLVVDITLTDINPDSITVGDTNIILNPATTETAGIVELATEAEAKAGTDTTRAMTPATAKAARDADANIVHRTGNETIAGSKTFTSNPAVKAVDPQFRFIQNDIVKGTKPETDQHSAVLFRDNADAAMGCIQNIYASDGSVHTRLGAYQPVAGSTSSVFLDMVYPASGDPYATAPTPAAGDNSTKIATTAWVNAKGKEFLPLAGGTMSGTISKAGGTFLNNTNSSSSLVLTGDKLSRNASTLMLFGLEHADFPGGFIVRAGDNTTSYTFLGKADGSLIWAGKNIVRSVNGTAADAAGNVAITSVASATKATQDGNGKVIADTYAVDTNVVHKSGNETIAGEKSFTGVLSFSNSSAGTGYRGFLYKQTNGSLSLGIRTSDNSSFQNFVGFYTNGNVELNANDGTNNKKLQLQPNGQLLWDSKYVLNNSYVAPNDTGAIMLTAGTAATKGAYFRLYGSSHSSGAGQFNIAASNGSSSKALVGKADGTLTWDGQNVLVSSTVSSTELGYLDGVTSAIQTQLNAKAALASPTFTGTPKAPTAASSTNNTQIATTAFVKSVLSSSGNGLATFSKAQNGYYKFANGLIIQWGELAKDTSGRYTVNFPTPFTSTNYTITAMGVSSGKITTYAYVQYGDKTTTSVQLATTNDATQNGVRWMAIGY